MVADSRPIGHVEVGRRVIEGTQAHHPSREFLAMMLRFTVSAKPSVGFVRDFVVEHSGEHPSRLDLKRGGLGPIASIGCWVAGVTEGSGGSTPEWLQRGRDLGVHTADEAEILCGAYVWCYEHLLRRHVEAIRGERTPSNHLGPRHLDPLGRRHLRSVFREVSRVQARLESEWASRLP